MRPAEVSVVGLGKLGLPLAAVMADRGLGVIGVDINKDVVMAAGEGRSLFHEPGLGELLPILATTNLTQAVLHTRITFVIVATPSLIDGSFSLDYVLAACRQIGTALAQKEDYHLVIIASTVMPGSCAGPIRGALEISSGKVCGGDFGLAHVPEFVALGSVVRDFQHPGYVLIGADDRRSKTAANAFYRRLYDDEPTVLLMSLVNAELAKIALNCYLTLKISFANQMAGICDRLPGASVNAVTTAVGLDPRVNPAYMCGGAPFGGPCFPRDVWAMDALGNAVGASTAVTKGAGTFNDLWLHQLETLAIDELLKIDRLGKIGILGLAFKPETDCDLYSPGATLLSWLGGYGAVGYDPLVGYNDSRCVASAEELVHRADVVVVMTNDRRWRAVKFRRGQTVIDVWRVLDGKAVEDTGGKYIAVGVGK